MNTRRLPDRAYLDRTSANGKPYSNAHASWPCDIGQLDEDWPTTRRFARSTNLRWPDEFANTEGALEQERRAKQQFERGERLEDWHWRMTNRILNVLIAIAAVGFGWSVYTGSWM